MEAAPPLPPGRALQLPGRGRTWVYDSGAGAPGRPAVLLLHGWTSTAALNWCRCFAPLSSHYRVVALDHRGHGRGIRSRRPFRLEDCADDAAAVIDALGLGTATVVGYSMGGPVAQLLWRRHRDRVKALVLCATAGSFATRRELSGAFGAMSLMASIGISLMPAGARRAGMDAATARWASSRSVEPWALEEWGRNDPSALIQAGLALSRFDSTPWLPQVDVPTAVVLTESDETVSPRRQRLMAEAIPGASIHPVPANHRACAEAAGLFVPVLLDALRAANERARSPVTSGAWDDSL